MITLTPSGSDDLPQINAAISNGGWVNLARGTFTPSAPIQIYNSVKLTGEGIGATTILSPSPTSDVIDINCQVPVKLEDFSITYSSQATAGQAISLQCPNNTETGGQYGNSSSVFRDLQILNAFVGINVIAGAYYVFDNLKIIEYANVGLITQNVNWPDAGDSTITACTIMGISGSLAGCLWSGGDGFRFINNKVLTSQYGIIVQLQAGAVNMRQMQIVCNSFDGHSVSSISFWPVGTGSLGGVILSSNIFNGTHRGISAPLPPIGRWINSLIDVGNNWYPDTVPGAVYSDFSSIINVVSVDEVSY